MKGYFNDPDKTAGTLKNGWLHTGDMGYLAGKNLHVCGRKKDMIIIAGKNYYPEDIEWISGGIEGIRRGNVVAFGFNARQEKESVGILAESRKWKTHGDRLERAIRERIRDRLGIRASIIEILPPYNLPKTSSGKLQRKKAVELYNAGELGKRLRFVSMALAKYIFRSKWSRWKSKFSRRRRKKG